MSFFRKRSVAIICCLIMIAVAMGIGKAKSQKEVLPVSDELPAGWNEVYVDPGRDGQPEYAVRGTSLRVIGGVAVFVLLIGALIFFSMIAAISRLGQRLLFGTRKRNSNLFRVGSHNHFTHRSHKPPPRGHGSRHFGGGHHHGGFHGKR